MLQGKGKGFLPSKQDFSALSSVQGSVGTVIPNPSMSLARRGTVCLEVSHELAQDEELKEQLPLKHRGRKAGTRKALIDQDPMESPHFFTKVLADGSCRDPWLLQPILMSTDFLPSCPSGLRWLSTSRAEKPRTGQALEDEQLCPLRRGLRHGKGDVLGGHPVLDLCYRAIGPQCSETHRGKGQGALQCLSVLMSSRW